jgi:peptide/nickel transport system substrate-binding protein
MVVALELEPKYISPLAPTISAVAQNFFLRPFNAFLELVDDQGRVLPYLAETLPALNSDSWQVFPDGRMETRTTLKPGLTWHDGAPLTASDFAFTFKVAKPAAGFSTAGAPHSVIGDVLAPDDRTIVIQWTELYPDAGRLQGGGSRLGLPPFPRHILEQAYEQETRDAFANHPYWSREFVGAGPYQLTRWELGSFIEATAFDGHVLGRPKIDRFRFVFPGDQNAVVASLRAGAVDGAFNAVAFPQGLELKREWAGSGGTVAFVAGSMAAVLFQFRPDYARPAAIRDVRIRRALAHGIDRATLGETIWAGEVSMLETIFDPSLDYYPVIDRALVKYPYDPRASERLMAEAGYAKAAGNVYASPTGDRLTLDLKSSQARPEAPVVAAGWRQVGFDVEESVVPRALATDPEARSSFPGMYLNVFGAQEVQQMTVLLASQAGGPENRWRGENRGGWQNPEYDALVATFNTTLEPKDRIELRARIARLISEELPSLSLSFNANVHIFRSGLRGLTRTSLYTTGAVTWNVERWDLD